MFDTQEMANEKQIVVRVPAEVPDRAKALADRMRDLPALAGLRVTASSVLRQAVLRGLDALEAETARPSKTRGRK